MARQIILILAGQVATMQRHKTAAQVVGRQAFKCFDALLIAPAQEEGKFDTIELEGRRGQTVRFAVWQKEI